MTDSYSAFSDNCKSFYGNKGIIPGTFRLQEVSRAFILEQLKALKPQKGTGLDGIGPRFLKDGADALADVVTYLVNLSITSKIVPACTKHAKVIPMYKKKSKLDVGNYRPVSVLTSISKVLEKAVHCQVEGYCNANNIIFPMQSGFRKSFSTDSCLVYLHDYIRDEISKGKLVGMALLDVQKAFDSVNHEMLCEKIRLAGIEPDWFISYLAARKQMVCVGESYSSSETIKCGVPQGSVLGPWCYLMYSNDIASSVSCKLLMYADDTVLLVSDKDINTLSVQLGNEVTNSYNWLVNNKLSMHMGKTECIVLSSKKKKHLTKDFSIKCHTHNVCASNQVKYLGLVMDTNLSSHVTVMSIVKKAHARLKFMYRHRNSLGKMSRQLLSSALIQPHFDYAATSWYMGSTEHLKHKLQVTQNKVVRFILNKPPRQHIGQNELDMVNLLNTEHRVKQLMMTHMYNIYNGNAPSYLCQRFIRIHDHHQHHTRLSEYCFVTPRVKSANQSNFSYWGVKTWNVIPTVIKTATNVSLFKSAVKRHYVILAHESEESDY